MHRCSMTVTSGKRCKNKTRDMYCTLHAKMLQPQLDVSSAVEYHQDNDGPGMVEDIWFLIGEYLPFTDIPVLCRTCKALLNSFTSKFFEKHPRYLVIKKHFKRIKPRYTRLRGIPVDDICKRATFHPQLEFICIDNFVYSTFNGLFAYGIPRTSILTPVTSYRSAKVVLRALAGKLDGTYSIFVDEAKQNIIPKLLDVAYRYVKEELTKRQWMSKLSYYPWCDVSRNDEVVKLLDAVTKDTPYKYKYKLKYNGSHAPYEKYTIFRECMEDEE